MGCETSAGVESEGKLRTGRGSSGHTRLFAPILFEYLFNFNPKSLSPLGVNLTLLI